MTHKHILMQLSSAWEAFQKGIISQLLREKHITARSLSYTSKCGREWGREGGERKHWEWKILGSCSLPQVLRGHLPVVFFKSILLQRVAEFTGLVTQTVEGAGASSRVLDVTFLFLHRFSPSCFIQNWDALARPFATKLWRWMFGCILRCRSLSPLYNSVKHQARAREDISLQYWEGQ